MQTLLLLMTISMISNTIQCMDNDIITTPIRCLESDDKNDYDEKIFKLSDRLRNQLNESIHPFLQYDKKITIGNREFNINYNIKITGLNGKNGNSSIPVKYIQHSKLFSNLLQDNDDDTIDVGKSNINLCKKDINFVFKTIIPAATICSQKKMPIFYDALFKNKSFYECIKIINLINYLDIKTENNSVIDSIYKVLKNKKIDIKEIEKCKALNIRPQILSNIAWIESSFNDTLNNKLLYQSKDFIISDEVSLDLAINNNGSKIGIVGLCNDKSENKITTFEKKDNINNEYVILQKKKIRHYQHKKKKYHNNFIDIVSIKDEFIVNSNLFNSYWYKESTKYDCKPLILEERIIYLNLSNLITSISSNSKSEIKLPGEYIKTSFEKYDIHPAIHHDKHFTKVASSSFEHKWSHYGISIYKLNETDLLNIKCTPNRVRSFNLSNDGSLCAVQTESQDEKDYNIIIYDANNGNILKTINYTKPLIQLMFTPKDTWIMTVPQEGSIDLINIFTKKTISTTLIPFYQKPTLPNSSLVLLHEKDHEVLLYGLFQSKEDPKKCQLKVYSVKTNAHSKDFFLGLYMQQNGIIAYDPNNPDPKIKNHICK